VVSHLGHLALTLAPAIALALLLLARRFPGERTLVALARRRLPIAHLPVQARAAVAGIARASFISSLNDLFLVAAIVAFVGAIGALALIRSRDFVAQGAHEGSGQAAAGAVEVVGA
jgi:hypothetical protein